MLHCSPKSIEASANGVSLIAALPSFVFFNFLP